jgi:UDP-N-acetylmuramoyl-tripeptide--D-alanyl-D-alanine ligase
MPTDELRNEWTLDEVLRATGGELLLKGQMQRFLGVSTDSRTIPAGYLFLALEGETFDGHQFVEQAVSNGASGVIVALGKKEAIESPALEIPVVGVADTLRAFGDLAEFWRRRHPIIAVAITGSNGKTTTKEMVAAILARSWNVLKNYGTFNNLVGVPLTLLQLDDTYQAAVVEMGMNQPGEIERLTEIVHPDVGIITNIQPAHLEGMGDLNGVQAAKGALFRGMQATATVVVNQDDPLVKEEASSFRGRQVGFSITDDTADVRLERIISMDASGSRFLLHTPNEDLEIYLPVIGSHHINNAVAAAAVTWALDLPANTICDALTNFQAVDKRMEVHRLPGDINIINDTYNANPGSMAAALETLRQVNKTGRCFAVLADMLEMGMQVASLHKQVGSLAANQGIDFLFAMGEQAPHLLAGAAESGMPGDRLIQARDHQEIALKVNSLLAPGDWVLVKGSRGMSMEKVVEIIISKRRHE